MSPLLMATPPSAEPRFALPTSEGREVVTPAPREVKALRATEVELYPVTPLERLATAGIRTVVIRDLLSSAEAAFKPANGTLEPKEDFRHTPAGEALALAGSLNVSLKDVARVFSLPEGEARDAARARLEKAFPAHVERWEAFKRNLEEGRFAQLDQRLLARVGEGFTRAVGSEREALGHKAVVASGSSETDMARHLEHSTRSYERLAHLTQLSREFRVAAEGETDPKMSAALQGVAILFNKIRHSALNIELAALQRKLDPKLNDSGESVGVMRSEYRRINQLTAETHSAHGAAIHSRPEIEAQIRKALQGVREPLLALFRNLNIPLESAMRSKAAGPQRAETFRVGDRSAASAAPSVPSVRGEAVRGPASLRPQEPSQGTEGPRHQSPQGSAGRQTVTPLVTRPLPSGPGNQPKHQETIESHIVMPGVDAKIYLGKVSGFDGSAGTYSLKLRDGRSFTVSRMSVGNPVQRKGHLEIGPAAKDHRGLMAEERVYVAITKDAGGGNVVVGICVADTAEVIWRRRNSRLN